MANILKCFIFHWFNNEFSLLWYQEIKKNMKMNLNTEIKSMYLHMLKKYFSD